MPVERIRIGRREAGRERPTLVVAEAGTNHDSSLSQAREMIEAAALAGADAVKFQNFKADEMYPPNIGLVETPAGRIDFLEYMRSREMPDEWLPELKAACDRAGVEFISTPFYLEAVPRLKDVAAAGLPVIVSTGFSTLGEIDEAVRTLRENGCRDILLLQCVAAYPTPPEECNLNVMETLSRAFGLPAGFSDHTTDWRDVPRLVAALGGCLIEKHFTLDKKLSGPDHPFALEPQELKRMVEGMREVESWPTEKKKRFVESDERFARILGCAEKGISPLEKEIYPCEKRSIRARRDIAAGERLSAESIGVLRFTRNGKHGISPKFYNVVLGARAARNISQGDGVTWEDLLLSSEPGTTNPCQARMNFLDGGDAKKRNR
jgi:N-acetylneuraminate synthase